MFYDYICPKCGNEREINHPMAEDPIIYCNKCIDTVMKRVITGGSGTHFKGNGWGNDFKGLSSGVERVKTTMKAEKIER